MDRNIKLLINKSEIAAGTRGASLGPDAVFTAARKANNTLFNRFKKQEIENQNFLLDQQIHFPNAKRAKGLLKVFEAVSGAVSDCFSNGEFPFILAGDHGSAGGTIAGIKKAYPEKRLGVVWIDAHGDLHTPYTTPSGNMHGMPLASALGEDNLEEMRNEVSDEVVELWGGLKSCGGMSPKMSPEDLVFIAVRDTEPQEEALMQRMNITNHTVEELRAKGCEKIVEKTMEQLNNCDIIYISFDVDSMDPELTSHGTGTPVENGISPEEARILLQGFAQWEKVVCMEFVEVNPCLDEKKNKMAEVTFELIESTITTLEG